jgi:imidazolonepropionase-like amidohydrolase
MKIHIRNARILTLVGPTGPRRGGALGDLGILPNGEVLIDDGKIAAVGKSVFCRVLSIVIPTLVGQVID